MPERFKLDVPWPDVVGAGAEAERGLANVAIVAPGEVRHVLDPRFAGQHAQKLPRGLLAVAADHVVHERQLLDNLAMKARGGQPAEHDGRVRQQALDALGGGENAERLVVPVQVEQHGEWSLSFDVVQDRERRVELLLDAEVDDLDIVAGTAERAADGEEPHRHHHDLVDAGRYLGHVHDEHARTVRKRRHDAAISLSSAPSQRTARVGRHERRQLRPQRQDSNRTARAL